MPTNIFVNLPVKDLNRSIAFFTKLKYTFNPQFTDENATCMIISEDIYAMLLVEKYFKTFTPKTISDSGKSTEVILALSADSRQEVDEMIARVLGAGGKESREIQDLGFIYSRGFEDLDGHLWEIFYMDPSTIDPN